MKELNHIDKIIILYSKNHYKRISDPLIDLGQMVDKACLLPEGHTTPYRMYLLVSETFSKVSDFWMQKDFYRRLFSKVGSLQVVNADHVYASDLMLGELLSLNVNDGDRVIWNVGEANPELWPLKGE